MIRNRYLAFLLLFVSCWFAFAQPQQSMQDQFILHEGDTVVFYGDSITEQRLYTSDIEMYTITRFPTRKIRFINSGVGGDKVSGGWAGPIDLRTERDIVGYRPAMVTIMLGMNDGYYRPFDNGILSTYSDGYRQLVDHLQSKLPNAKFTLIKPSPYDDVTRNPQWEPGYNSVLVKFGDVIGKLGDEKKLLVTDLNAPVVQVLAKAKQIDPVMATTLVLDRVHPGSGIHWIMAEMVLKTWNAPSTVTSVTIDGAKGILSSAINTELTQLTKSKTGLMWTQNDRALPLPLSAPEVDPYLALTVKASDFAEALNQQPLRVTGLAGTYQLWIDEQLVGKFSAEELAQGVNLATLETPMLAQSRLVALDTERKNSIEEMHFRLQNDARDAESQAAVKKLATVLDAAFERQRHGAQPVPHHYRLMAMKQRLIQ